MTHQLFNENRQKLFSMKKYRYKNSVLHELNIDEEPIKCKACDNAISKKLWKERFYVCDKCGYHHSINAKARLNMLIDEDSFKEINADLSSKDPLSFPGYKKKLKEAESKSHLKDALLTGFASIGGIDLAIGVLDSSFFMGSMGSIVGEKFTLLVEEADKHSLPLLVFSASGGARMQEGLFSLMQMAKTAAAIEKFSEHGGFFISYLTHPTTGGVSASFANLGDIIIAEPGALIGFAGPRVIEQTIGQTLPEGFQSAEFQEEHGFVDMIVQRKDMKKTIFNLLKLHSRK